MNVDSDKVFEELSGGTPMEMVILRDTADRLFRDKKIRFVYLPKTDEEKASNYYDSVLIILNERICFWFLHKKGEWIYDGWEMGDYHGAWSEKSLTPPPKI